MKLPVPFIQLPVIFDAARLAEEVAALGEDAWLPHPQGFAGNSMLPLVAVHGDPLDESFDGPMQATPLLARCPYLMTTLSALGVVLGRSRLMRLSGHAEVTPHADQGYYWAERMRVHVPIVTQPTVRFDCGDATVNMAAGECWIFDTWRLHRVLNDADASRIHLVVDTVGGDGFATLLASGRPHDAPRDGWQPSVVGPDAVVPALAFERCNVPAVMTPWEMKSHFGALFADTVPHPQLEQVVMLSSQLTRTWRALWAQYGDSTEGMPLFRAAMDRFNDEVGGPSKSLQLRNTLGWYGAMLMRISQYAVRDRAVSARSEYGMSDLA